MIPIILIQQNNQSLYHNNSLINGWDIIIPQNWALTFWLSFIYAGARMIGLNNERYLAYESQQLYFPHDYLETNTAKTYYYHQALALYQNYQNKSKGKCINYYLYGIQYPFLYQIYYSLNYYIIRNWYIDHNGLIGLSSANSSSSTTSSSTTSSSSLCYYVPISIIYEKGKGNDYAGIYIPTKVDVLEWLEHGIKCKAIEQTISKGKQYQIISIISIASSSSSSKMDISNDDDDDQGIIMEIIAVTTMIQINHYSSI